jgi:hypothetical protein
MQHHLSIYISSYEIQGEKHIVILVPSLLLTPTVKSTARPIISNKHSNNNRL